MLRTLSTPHWSILYKTLFVHLHEVLLSTQPVSTWNLPTETGTQELPANDFIANHMRRPVYFGQAVQRLSMRLPSAIWLEAGSCSTIAMMARQAFGRKSPNSHFQSLNITTTTAGALQDLTDTTIKLWREGLGVNFWPHHADQVAHYRPLILPPCPFKKTIHWMDINKPPKGKANTTNQLELPSTTDPVALWSLEASTGGDMHQQRRSARFRIHTNSERFNKILDQHRILRAYPLCPSTLQLHIAINALASLHPAYANGMMQPRLLGMDSHVSMTNQSSARVTWLDVGLTGGVDSDSHVWHWELVSEDANSGLHLLCHVSGTVAFQDPQNDKGLLEEFSRYARLVCRDRALAILESWDVDEILQGRSLYRSFSEIVEYDP